MPQVVAFQEPDLPPILKAGAIEVLEGAWPSQRSLEERMQAPLARRAYEPVCMLLVEGDLASDPEHTQVLAYLAIPTKTVTHAGRAYVTSGLTAVSTHPDHRGTGHGARLVRAAYERIAASGVDLAVFTCDEPLAGFYEAAGFERMPTTVVVGGTRDEPFRADSLRSPEGYPKATLMACLSDLARAHRADFEHADLYLDLRPGDLW